MVMVPLALEARVAELAVVVKFPPYVGEAIATGALLKRIPVMVDVLGLLLVTVMTSVSKPEPVPLPVPVVYA